MGKRRVVHGRGGTQEDTVVWTGYKEEQMSGNNKFLFDEFMPR